MSITHDNIRNWLQAFTDRVNDQKKYLTKLDSAIGDGDHGENMSRGLRAAMDKLSEGNEATIDKTLKSVAMSLISKTGGASGPLYGTLFMEAAKIAKDKDEVGLDEWANMMGAGLEGIKKRGKANLGDKTMVDAFTPAVEALQEAAESEDDVQAAMQAAAEAAEQGMEDTVEMVAKKGRASYLGERSKGHQDPGATSTFYLFDTAAETLGNRSSG